MGKLTITENFCDSYNELKNDLKDKYARMLSIAIDQAREKATDKTAKILSPSFLQLLEETESLKNQRNQLEQDFYKSDKYITAQDNLKDVKIKLDNVSSEEKESIEKDFNKALSTITTLNITIKNRLKDIDEKITLNKQSIKNEISIFGDEINKIKNEVMSLLQWKIAKCVKDYNDELIQLNEMFGIESTTESEFPFDENIIKIDVPVFSLSSSSSFVGNRVVDEGKTFINAKNNSNVIN